ncbi:MAG: hypothetical protein MI751_07705 [Pseudomonadales bacterium]|jgi:hypothetical protein|uniref:hypothetical protein n=1 Tax=Alcanivorax sp. TaxID=1872427 RepID=UPI002585C185|nr:hypothetical protein [Alcanivorax sp.]MCG8437954.1 hypothetical protein [Pseudomonadales bacterium]
MAASNQISLTELSILSEMRRVSVTLKEGESGFSVVVSRGGEPSVLVTQRKSIRYFKRLDTAARFLLDLGVNHFACELMQQP